MERKICIYYTEINGIDMERKICIYYTEEQWKERSVFITLKSKRIYLGILVDHTKDIRFEYTIKIIPIYSGYRNENGKINWDFKYPRQKDAVVELIIPQSEITTFAFWNDSSEFENRPE